ncbi:MAG: UDP-3-O-acyl-N-acetylglucosamine deacetylase [Desulfobacula sp.]|jgi:UDP-3-O-[3-hydroxymyristoyl] N-acetylglucosamine deacetylase|uniref:UDP-3-O-acyl-N-acetylglucosamine deacetylase n=1 Tax=Desulfobacula sp. TaxID=2593537 RepID=UPI001DD2FA7C|nr:UDP-3-O-acyl-N-acetylglucosamine deacetylase [Desulfobacula sp.]MBT3485071.1 UDP-3-O-acyl-N-acetylglucosamine deacetylase [Desulfobacula sp.]MBT3804625.1 UDP-3-O-acyl-N-acetylglucosamine deacetylase [Desulfobacula sp.]MBT4025082.1 UDP-3-O-acyl-N-acetylglucosamine deacetylase [Desulfobacula sp.]MBT4198235.1 UDP-3-O-acyl-N-acetylglucosamine deacetylase [Desulfobacula sp.]
MTKYFLQRTLSKSVSVSGTGVHSGKKTHLTIHPAPENHGIKFRRIDLPGTQDIQAIFKLVVDTSLATVLGNNGTIVSTIEHLMASFAGLGIDNALVEVNDHEIPIMDGSAKVFTQLLKNAGIIKQAAPKHFLIVKKPIKVVDKDKSVIAYPEPCFKITCKIDFQHPLIGKQEITFDRAKNNFGKEISQARTFGFIQDLELLKKFSLGKGGSLDNAIIIDKDRILNEEGLRYPDEFVRHKLLDSLGDFSLLGMPIKGHIITHKSGHTLNHLFIKNFLKNKDAWETGPAKME